MESIGDEEKPLYRVGLGQERHLTRHCPDRSRGSFATEMSDT
jgi:hypothetical protein